MRAYERFPRGTRWWQKALLRFCRTRVERFDRGLFVTQISYKVLRGRFYVLSTIELPPVHPNCRCAMVKL